MGNTTEDIAKLSIEELVKASQETRHEFFEVVKTMKALPAPEVVVDEEFIQDAEEEMQRMTLEVPSDGEAVGADSEGSSEELSMEDQLMGKSKAESSDEESLEDQLMGKSKAKVDDTEEESLEDQLMGKSKAKEEDAEEESLEDQLMGKAKAESAEEESLEDQIMGGAKKTEEEPERMTLSAEQLSESEEGSGISDDEIANLSNSIEESVKAEGVSDDELAALSSSPEAGSKEEKEHVVVDHPNDVDQETIDRLMAEAKAKASEVDVQVKRFDIELEPPKEYLDIHLDIEAAESLKVVSKFKAIFEQKRQELEEGMVKAESSDEGSLDQSEIDNLLGGGEEGTDDGNEVLNQDELDALFAAKADESAEEKSEEDDGNEVLNQDELDALFATKTAEPAEEKAEEDDGNEVLNQDELDALFATKTAEPAEEKAEEDDGDEVLNQDELDALFATKTAESAEEKSEEDDGNEVLNQDELDALFAGENDSSADEASALPADEVLAEGVPTIDLTERIALTDDEKVVFEHPNDITQELVDRLMDKAREHIEKLDEKIKMPEEELVLPATADLHLSLEECQKAAHDLEEKRRHVEFDKDYDFYMSISREISESDRELVEDFELDKAMEFVAKENDIYSQKIVLPDEELISPENVADKIQLDFVEALEFSVGKHGHFIDKVQDKLNLVEDVIDNASTFVSEDALEKAKEVEEESLEEFTQDVEKDDRELIAPEPAADLHLSLEEALSLLIGSVSEHRKKENLVEDTVELDAQDLDVDALPDKLSMDDIDSLFAANGDDVSEPDPSESSELSEEENVTLSVDDIDSLFADANGSDDSGTAEMPESSEDENTTLSVDDIDSLFAANGEAEEGSSGLGSETGESPVLPDEEENATLSVDDIDSLFADANGASEVEEMEEENATLSTDDIDKLFASTGESETMSEEKEELSETVNESEIEAVLSQTANEGSAELNVEEEHPNDVDQETVDDLMEDAIEQVESFEQEIVRYEEELVVPEATDLHIQESDIHALNAFYGNEEVEVSVGTSAMYDGLDVVLEEVEDSTEEESSVMSADDIDGLFATPVEEESTEDENTTLSMDDIDSLFASNDSNSEEEEPAEESSVMSADDIDSLFASSDSEEEAEEENVNLSVDDIDGLFNAENSVEEVTTSNEDLQAFSVAEEHPNDVDQATIDSLMETVKEEVRDFEEKIERHEEELVEPAVAELHLKEEDVESLSEFYDSSKKSADRVGQKEEAVAEHSETSEEVEEGEILSRDELDDLFASNEVTTGTSEESSEEDVNLSADDIDSLFSSDSSEQVESSQNEVVLPEAVAEEHPNDVEQATIDSLMETVKEEVRDFEEKIDRPEEELVVPDLAELHLKPEDVESLHAHYDRSMTAQEPKAENANFEEVYAAAEATNEPVNIVEQDSDSEENEVLSKDELDSLFAPAEEVQEDRVEAEVVRSGGEAPADDPVLSALERLKALRKK